MCPSSGQDEKRRWAMARALTLVLALSFHFVVVIVACTYLGKFLDERAPLANVSWLAITFPLGLAVILHNCYVLYKFIIRWGKGG